MTQELEEPGTNITLFKFVPTAITKYTKGSHDSVFATLYRGYDQTTGRHYQFLKSRPWNELILLKPATIVGSVESHAVDNNGTCTKLMRVFF